VVSIEKSNDESASSATNGRIRGSLPNFIYSYFVKSNISAIDDYSYLKGIIQISNIIGPDNTPFDKSRGSVISGR